MLAAVISVPRTEFKKIIFGAIILIKPGNVVHKDDVTFTDVHLFQITQTLKPLRDV